MITIKNVQDILKMSQFFSNHLIFSYAFKKHNAELVGRRSSFTD